MKLTEKTAGGIKPFAVYPKVWACINVFEDRLWLERCVKSLQGKVAGIIIVDGAYQGFPHDKPYSTDGTLEIAEEYADIVIIPKHTWATETIKRNEYVKHVPENDWWLRIDADEELDGEIPIDLTGICYMIQLYRPDLKISYPIHALFKKHATSKYEGCHHAVWYQDRILVTKEDWPILEGCQLIHHSSERTRERWEKKGAYYPVLTKVERDFRAKNGL